MRDVTLLRFTSRTRNDCLEITSEAGAVTAGFVQQLFSEIQAVKEAEPRQSPKALIEVIALSAEMTFFERFHAWERTFPLIRRMRVAYVVTGRPLSTDVTFFELVAHNRGGPSISSQTVERQSSGWACRPGMKAMLNEAFFTNLKETA